jgi:acyl carrier protein
MNSAEILNIQAQIIKDIFDNYDVEITRSTTADDIDEWDSLSHIQLVAAIEKKFNIRFALAELQSLKNVGEMTDLIAKKLGVN